MGNIMKKILVGTFEQATADELLIRHIGAEHHRMQGYEIGMVDGQPVLYGKNAATGETNYEDPVICWDIVKQIGERWYIDSPSNDPRFVNWRDFIPEGVTVQCDEEMLVLEEEDA